MEKIDMKKMSAAITRLDPKKTSNSYSISTRIMEVIHNSGIEASYSEEVIRVNTDYDLTFHGHITFLCSKVTKK